MYIWNIKNLNNVLIDGNLNQRSLFLYIFIYVILTELGGQIYYLFPNKNYNNYDYIQAYLYLIIVATGTYFSYILNGGINGKEFAERYFSIGFVVAIRFVVILTPIIIVISIITIDEIEEDVSTQWYDIIIFGLLEIIYYWRCLVHINYVAKRKKL